MLLWSEVPPSCWKLPLDRRPSCPKDACQFGRVEVEIRVPQIEDGRDHMVEVTSFA